LILKERTVETSKEKKLKKKIGSQRSPVTWGPTTWLSSLPSCCEFH